jgi:hypothetical protein
VLSSDVRVRSPATGLTTCADVTVVCDPLEVDADDPHGVLDLDDQPRVLSTRATVRM